MLSAMNEENINRIYAELLNSVDCGVFAYTVPQYEVFNINKEARNIFEFENVFSISLQRILFVHLFEDIQSKYNLPKHFSSFFELSRPHSIQMLLSENLLPLNN